MARGAVSRRLRHWRAVASALALAGLCLLTSGSRAEEQPSRSLLLLPVKSHWLAAPLAEAVMAALPEALSQAGLRVTVGTPDSALVQRAFEEGRIPVVSGGQAQRVASEGLAIAVGADAFLTGETVEAGSEARLEADLVGAVSQRKVELSVSAPSLDDKRQTGKELAQRLAERLTPEVWGEAGADEEGRRAAAGERYLRGRMALAEGMYRAAELEFEAALAGEWDNPDYLSAAAEAEMKVGDPARALSHLQVLSSRSPGVLEVKLRLGDTALAAGRPEQAEAAFRGAAELAPEDPRVIEGLARASRARGQRAQAEDHYRELVARLPALADAPSWLPGLLANRADDSVRLTAVAPDEVNRQLGWLYLRAGEYAAGVGALLSYHMEKDRPAYENSDYLVTALGLDEAADRIAGRVEAIFAARAQGQGSEEQAVEELDGMHQQSSLLVGLAEAMRVSPRLEPAHRYRVFAYALLNQSNFESRMFALTNDRDHKRRADLLRDASREARADAQGLGAELAGG
jgi:hypothetical protein